MACSPPNNSSSGYATPSAMVFALALSLVSIAAVSRSITALNLARHDLQLTRAELLLDGAMLQAQTEIIRSTSEPPYHWDLNVEGKPVAIWAQPLKGLLSLSAAEQQPDSSFLAFGVADIESLRARLHSAAADAPISDVGALDPALKWQMCAKAMISPFGLEEAYVLQPFNKPGLGDKPASWRIGEAWRVSAIDATGWRDERIVRFTGDARHPAATVFRRLSRSQGDEGQCESILNSLSVGAS